MSQSKFDSLKEMIISVAEALGPDLRAKTAFVGGVTTGLLITDEFTRQSVRATDDVDLITSALGYVQHAQLEEELRHLGFKDDTEDEIICRKLWGNLKVDFMPTDESLGFTNRWYKRALATAQDYEIKPHIVIRLITPIYFIGTKLEAWNGRGNGDMLASRDLEDIFNLINGRESLNEEIRHGDPELRDYISQEMEKLSRLEDYDYLLQATTNGVAARGDILHERVTEIIGLSHG